MKSSYKRVRMLLSEVIIALLNACIPMFFLRVLLSYIDLYVVNMMSGASVLTHISLLHAGVSSRGKTTTLSFIATLFIHIHYCGSHS